MTKKTWAAWIYHPSKGARLIEEFDGEYPEGWYDCPKKAFESAAKPVEETGKVVELTRGQKGAATRKANAEAKAAQQAAQ